ncbi:MAG: hypothetical protein ABR593_04530 [Candidatus Limnocylindria bacterium]
MYGVVVFLHVLGAFGFVLAHGISMLVSFRLRGERDRTRQAHLLELSSVGINLMYIGLGVLLPAGIAAGFLGGHWGRGWIWAAIGTLVVVMAIMYSVATPFYGRMRVAAGAPVPEQIAARMKSSVTEADLEALATSGRPMWLAAVGGVGLAIIIWLMLAKPF